jgi:hypothetical protein
MILPMFFNRYDFGMVFNPRAYSNEKELSEWKVISNTLMANWNTTHTSLGNYSTWRSRMINVFWTIIPSKTKPGTGLIFYSSQFPTKDDLFKHARMGPAADGTYAEQNSIFFGGKSAYKGIPSYNIGCKTLDTFYESGYAFDDIKNWTFTPTIEGFTAKQPRPLVTTNAVQYHIALSSGADGSAAIAATSALMEVVKSVCKPREFPYDVDATQCDMLDAISFRHSDRISTTLEQFGAIVMYMSDVQSAKILTAHAKYKAWLASYSSLVVINTLNMTEWERPIVYHHLVY